MTEELGYIEDTNNTIKLEVNNKSASLEDIERIIEEAKDEEIIFKVKSQYIAKCDIKEMQSVLNAMTDKDKVNKENAINEAIKQAIVIEESKEQGIAIAEHKIETFKTVAENMYETSDKSLTKEEYISKWMRIQENEEISFLYRSKILMQIAEETFKPLDENTKEKLAIFNNEKNVTNLDAAYESHVNFLARDYLI